MPYATNADLPEGVRGALPAAAQSIWREAHNSCMDSDVPSEERCAQVAWGAVKRAGWEKGEDGWHKMSVKLKGGGGSLNGHFVTLPDGRVVCAPGAPTGQRGKYAGAACVVGADFAEDADATTYIQSLIDAGEWSDAVSFAKPETINLVDVEVLAAGTWTDMNGKTVTITEADLDGIVTAFGALAETVKVPLKLGHPPEGKLGPYADLATGEPALGWASTLRRVKDKLLASFTKVPKVLGDLVSAAAYRRVSAELESITEGETSYPMVLTGVGLLGAKAPAIKTLADLRALYARRERTALVFAAEGGHLRALAEDEASLYELERMVRAACNARWPSPGGMEVWVRELYQDHAIIEGHDGRLFSVSFSVEGDHVVLGEPTEVEQVYQPTSQEGSDMEMAAQLAAEKTARTAAEQQAKAAETARDAAIGEANAARLAAKRTRAEVAVDKAIGEGRVLPKDRAEEIEDLVALDDQQKTVKLAAKDKDGKDTAEEITPFERARRRLLARPEVVKFGTLSAGGTGDADGIPEGVVRMAQKVGVPLETIKKYGPKS